MIKKSLVFIGLLGFIALGLSPNNAGAFDKLTFGDQSLSVYGFLRNNTGYFLETQPYQLNDDKLATERTWLRTYTDWKASDHFRFWADIQFAYEPEYGVEKGSVSKEDGKEYSEYDDINDVLREAYFELIPNKTTDIKIGRQIVIWGESLTERVGDVIQPEDRRFTLAFSNLEDTRIPQWMIRGIQDINSIASSFEWIVSPLLTGDEYRVNRVAGLYNLANGQTGQRFAVYPEDRFLPPNSVGNPILFPQAPGVVVAPFSYDWSKLPDFVPGLGGTYVPNALPVVHEEYPDTWTDMRYGFRTSTDMGGYLFGLIYWHTQEYDPIVKRGGLIPGVMIPTDAGPLPAREYTLVHPTEDIMGVYMSKQLPWPGVVRAEAIYSPNKPFNTFDQTDSDAIVKRDYIKYMVAYDLQGFLYFNWHKTAPFDITIEHVGEWIPNADNLQYQALYATKQPEYVPRFSGRISTNWFYNRLATDVVFSYYPWGNSGLVMPSAKWTPGWLNQNFSMELKYINIFGDNNYEGLGFLRTKDMVVLTTQINF